MSNKDFSVKDYEKSSEIGKGLTASESPLTEFSFTETIEFDQKFEGIPPLSISQGSRVATDPNIGFGAVTVRVGQNLQQAIDIVDTEKGGTIFLRPGTHTVTSALTGVSNLKIIGDNKSTTTIDFNSTAANLSFTGTGVYTTGTITAIAGGVNVTGSGTLWLANVTAGQHLFLGTRWYLIAAVTGNTTLILAEAYGDNLTLPTTYRIATVKRNIVFEQVEIINSTGTALVFTDCRDLSFNNVLLRANAIGVSFTNVSIVEINATFTVNNTSHGATYTNCGIFDVESFPCVGNGGNGHTINNMKTATFGATVTNSNTADGFNITTGEDINIQSEIAANGGQGVELVSACTGVLFRECLVNNNTSDGVRLTATSDRCRFVNSRFNNNGAYGINLAAATDDDNLILGNHFFSNTTAAVNNAGTGTVIRSNIGVADFP